MADVKARIRVLADTSAGAVLDSTTMTVDRDDRSVVSNTFPCKEFSITDDVLNVSDAASVSISNVDGINSGKVTPGQRIEIDVMESTVASGQWVRTFTGRVTTVDYTSDVTGGSTIMIGAMDLGWHLTSCDATPLTRTQGGSLAKLLQKLIDPTWGFASTQVAGLPDVITNNFLNRHLKQGRTGIERLLVPPKTILPFIQVEPGQKPWDVLQTYFAREGVLLNVGAKGQLIVFRPNYATDSPYEGVEYYPTTDSRHVRNNVVGRPTLSLSIDGLYSEVQCWSTCVTPTNVRATAIQNNPNAAFEYDYYRPDGQASNSRILRRRKSASSPNATGVNPLPFERLGVITDGEAINSTMRKNRAIWKLQMDAFNSWRYEVELVGHSQAGVFLVSDTMMNISDTIHKISDLYYVQSVRRSLSIGEGARARLVLRRPLIDPALTRSLGGGATRK